MTPLSILFISLMTGLGSYQLINGPIGSTNPVPASAILIEDNDGNDWYAEPSLYYDYLHLYSDTTESAIERIVDVYALDVDKKLLSGKRRVKFFIDDNDFSGHYYIVLLKYEEYAQYFPHQ